MATMAAGQRGRRLAFAPLRLLSATARDSTFVIAGIPVQLIALGVLLAPCVMLLLVRHHPRAWLAIGVVSVAVALVLAARAPLTAIQRHRCWSMLGVDIPATAPAPGPTVLLRTAASLRAESTWRQLAYHLLAGPLLAAGGLLTLAAWAGGAGMAAAFAYGFAFGSGPHQFQSPKPLIALTVAGGLVLLIAPFVARAVTWLDVRAARALLGPNRSAELERRVETLSESRAGVVDAADAERRRIERDLHDGAQQRLVSLAMNLGMARENLTELPPAAQRVIAEAHDEAKEALAELRALIRGLHPAVLEDRGLDAALSGIAARAPLPVRVTVDVPARATPTIEAVAYFVVSECLTNIARHAQAGRAEVAVRRTGDTLLISVFDDGVGGAAPGAGSGLASLAQRARSVDGRLAIDSPAGGPTIITVELPCGS
jgi:signal transduction histidine kinase